MQESTRTTNCNRKMRSSYAQQYIARLALDDIFVDKIHVVVYVDVFHLSLAKHRGGGGGREGTIIRRGILRLRFTLYLERQLTYKQLLGSLIKAEAALLRPLTALKALECSCIKDYPRQWHTAYLHFDLRKAQNPAPVVN